MISVAILQLISQAFKVSLVQLRDFDFVELNFSFIMLDYLLDFMLKFIIVLFYELQPMFLTYLELFVDFQNTSNFFLFGCNYCPKNCDIVIIVSSQVAFSLLVGFSFLSKLAIIISSEFFNSSAIAIVIVFELIPETGVIVD